jgi:hypothetical protein
MMRASFKNEEKRLLRQNLKAFIATKSTVQEMLQLVLVAHAYNPSYSGGRDQEDCG